MNHSTDRIHNSLIADKDVNVILPESHDMPLDANEVYLEMFCSNCDWKPEPVIEKSHIAVYDIYETLLPHMLTMQMHSDAHDHETIMKCYTPSQSIVQTSVVPRPKIAQFFRHSNGEPTRKGKCIYWSLALSAIPVFIHAMSDGLSLFDTIPIGYTTFWAWSTYNRISGKNEHIPRMPM